MDELVLIGKSVSTFGIKGELKVISDFEYKKRAFLKGRRILLNNVSHVITSVRYHKNYVLITIDNLDNINDVLEFVGFNLYILKRDLNLGEDEYLYSDLENATVKEDDVTLGVIKEIMDNRIYKLARVKGEKEFLLPLIENYIIRFDKLEKVLYTKNARDLIL